MGAFERLALGCFAIAAVVNAVTTQTEQSAEFGANPIRKVVTLLQNMQKETEAEGDRAKDLFDAFNCYCTKTLAELSKSIEDAKGHVDELSANIEELAGSNAQLEQELKDIAKDIASATKSVEEASAQRKTEATAYAAESAEMTNTIGALDSAIPALKEGLETPAAVFAQLNTRLGGMKSPRVSNFLQNQNQIQGTGSDAILGVLEQMREDMKANLMEATQQEEEALETFKQLTSAKKKEIAAGTDETNEKSGRLASQKQQGADNKADLEDTSVSLASDEKTFVAVTENCKLKTDEFETAKTARNEELAAISEAVKILNSDEALELFKKSLPSPTEEAASFFQRTSKRQHIRHMIARSSQSSLNFAQVSMHTNYAQPQIDLTPLKKSAGEMIASMQEEQKDEDAKMALCKKELATAAQEKKALSTTLLQAESRMGVVNNEIADIQAQMKEVEKEIADVDMSVQEATIQRKKEKAEFTAVMSELTMSSDLLLKARQVLEKMYAPPAKEEFVQQSATFDDSLDNFLRQAPETAGPAKKQGAAGMGAVGLLSTLIADIKHQQTAEEKEENDAQAEFDKYMADTTEAKRAKKNDITSMEATVSRLEETLNDQKTVHGETQDEIDAVVAKEHALHAECDFLLENYDEIKKARTDEIESINNAIAILAGADFGKAKEEFLQRQ